MGGEVSSQPANGLLPVLASLPAIYPEWLGDRSFCEVHGLRFPYVAGEMANGIATTAMCIAAAKAGFRGCFGAGGLGFARGEEAVNQLVAELGWAKMGRRVKIDCFNSDPSVSSSLKFLRKTPWARTKVEDLYLEVVRTRIR